MCTPFSSKSNVPYIVGGAFSMAFQWHMTCLIWKKIALNIVGQRFGDL